MNFFVGQKVVCVRDDWVADRELVPVAGNEYTIRSIDLYDDGPALRFYWLINAPRQYCDTFAECTFSAFHDGVPNFRPVIERDTSIEIFRKLLNPSPTWVSEDA